MRLSDREIRRKTSILRSDSYNEEHLQQVIRSAKEAFYESEKDEILTGPEFLYQQAGYIRKRWWVLQGFLLAFLWMLLKYAAVGNYYAQRCMGTVAPLFVLLLLPELWKNRTANAMEVEGAAYFSLRQIYSARLLMFAVIDLLMLSAFSMAVVGSGRVVLEDVALQFFLPLVITCCVCFHTLYSKREVSEGFSVFLCIVWAILWLQLILNGNIYETVSVPVWYVVLTLSVVYLLYCIYRGQKDWKRMWEADHSDRAV